MKILAISGSGRASSTNTALLHAVAEIARPNYQISVFDKIANLPVFSPDFEVEPLPKTVQTFIDMIKENDGLIISSPEYVRSIPGGLKNAIDWLVSRDEIVNKPIVLMHASHRGADMLQQLRLVLTTVSNRFSQDLFLRFELLKLTPDEISHLIANEPNKTAVINFLRDFKEDCSL